MLSILFVCRHGNNQRKCGDYRWRSRSAQRRARRGWHRWWRRRTLRFHRLDTRTRTPSNARGWVRWFLLFIPRPDTRTTPSDARGWGGWLLHSPRPDTGTRTPSDARRWSRRLLHNVQRFHARTRPPSNARGWCRWPLSSFHCQTMNSAPRQLHAYTMITYRSSQGEARAAVQATRAFPRRSGAHTAVLGVPVGMMVQTKALMIN